MAVKIFCIGDVVGKPGRTVLAEQLKKLIDERGIDFVVCNAENAAGGSGLTPQIFKKLLRYGIDVVTLGDHVYKKVEIVSDLRNSDRVVRPANLPDAAVGRRWTVVATRDGMHKIAVMTLLGQMYMRNCDSPWDAADKAFKEIPSDVKIRVVDFHAEASSEKIAMGWHLNGRASVVFGTHTHIPTADARVLDGGTAYISDVGMTGPYDSVLGRKKDRVLYAMRTAMPTPFEVAKDDPRMCGVLATVDSATGKAVAVERIEVIGQAQEGPAYDSDDGVPQRQ